jgi:transcriptional regulator GlxA family with amidase domain
VRGHLRAPLDVDALARHASMSPRHFARSFRQELGVTPARAVERLRTEAAHAAFASGASSVHDVAMACGFGNAERMRRSFLRVYGTPPSAIRRSRHAAR